MTPRTILIKLMTATLPIPNALIEHGNKIINTGTINNHQILHEEPICCIPPAVQHPRCWVQQITDLLVVDLGERGLYRVFLFLCLRVFPVLGHWVPDILYGSRDDAIGFIRLEDILTELVLHSCHCIGLPTASLPIGKDSHWVSIQSFLNKILQYPHIIHQFWAHCTHRSDYFSDLPHNWI